MTDGMMGFVGLAGVYKLSLLGDSLKTDQTITKPRETVIMVAKRVAVIGAGPSGAIATDALVKEQAFETIRVFDRRGAIGGTW